MVGLTNLEVGQGMIKDHLHQPLRAIGKEIDLINSNNRKNRYSDSQNLYQNSNGTKSNFDISVQNVGIFLQL